MARTARIATTVTARYSPASGAKDGFWLDGRLSGRRESRMADITLDREDRGAFFAVFARPAASGDAEADNASVRRALDRMSNDVKNTTRNIDTEINELADCAVEVCGRISISQEGVRQPYFAGVIVKDNEVAAVTMGRGCAYLYRGDALYPLTGDDFVLEPVDALGNVVHNLEAYCAGTAGTVRYSNIAPLLPDDCLIVCNREVMETLGQKEVLRLLYEAEDQCDAAGLMVTSASAKSPGLPVQFLIGFAETVNNGERGSRAVPFRAEKGSVGAAAAMSAAAAGPFAAFRGKASEPVEEIEDEGEEPDEAAFHSEPVAASAAVSSKRTAPPPPRPDHIRREQPSRRGPGLDPRKIALALLMVAIAAGSIFAIYKILTGNGPAVTPTTAPTATAAPTLETTPGQETPTPTAGELSTPTPAPGSPTAAPKLYTVQSGDSLYRICMNNYGTASDTLYQKIMAANIATYPSFTSADKIQPGWVLTLP